MDVIENPAHPAPRLNMYIYFPTLYVEYNNNPDIIVSTALALLYMSVFIVNMGTDSLPSPNLMLLL